MRQEWDFTRDYLAFESLRLGDRLRLHVSVDEQALRAAVPPFLLQPLVENAVQHGVSGSAAGGDMSIRIARDDGDADARGRHLGSRHGMIHIMRTTDTRSFVLAAAFAAVVLTIWAASASAQTPVVPRVSLEIEGGPWWVSRNDVRIPSATGTDFSMLDVTGAGPHGSVRVAATIRLAARHGLRMVAAPLRATGTGAFSAPVAFAGRTFEAGVPTEGIYQFNTYRLGYRYALHQGRDWQVEIGAALLTRDAKIELRQGTTTARDTDLGFVPLASFGVNRRLSDRAWLVIDVEGLGSKQGRAVDAAVKLAIALSAGWTLGAGYRTIEGGADVESVYNFAWLHFGVVSLRYGF